MLKKGLLKEYQFVLKGIFKISDLLIIFCSFFLYYKIKFNFSYLSESYLLLILFSLFIFYITANLSNLYRPWRGETLQSELMTLSSVFCIFSSILFFILFFIKIGHEFSREWLFISLVISYLLLCVSRTFLRTILKKLRSLGFNQRQVCVVVFDAKALKLYRKIAACESLGINITSIFSDDPALYAEQSFYGRIDELKHLLKGNVLFDQIWIIGSLRYEPFIHRILEYAKDKSLSIRYIPDLSSLNLLNHSFSQIAGLTVLNIQDPPINTTAKLMIKRFEDIFLSLVFIIILSPIYILISILIKLTSKGPVFYRQVRISYDNKPFYILKFRSMPVGIEKTSGAVWAKKGENRATKLGSFLRKTSLDEIPQFFNVLNGEMSIVGPRPERPKFVRILKEQVPGYMKKHMVKAGITGWAQVNGWRGNTDIHKRIEYDLYYINNWSLLFDLKIIFMTFLKGIFNKNAY